MDRKETHNFMNMLANEKEWKISLGNKTLPLTVIFHFFYMKKIKQMTKCLIFINPG